jgi:hypothetical protein
MSIDKLKRVSENFLNQVILENSTPVFRKSQVIAQRKVSRKTRALLQNRRHSTTSMWNNVLNFTIYHLYCLNSFDCYFTYGRHQFPSAIFEDDGGIDVSEYIIPLMPFFSPSQLTCFHRCRSCKTLSTNPSQRAKHC